MRRVRQKPDHKPHRGRTVCNEHRRAGTTPSVHATVNMESFIAGWGQEANVDAGAGLGRDVQGCRGVKPYLDKNDRKRYTQRSETVAHNQEHLVIMEKKKQEVDVKPTFRLCCGG